MYLLKEVFNEIKFGLVVFELFTELLRNDEDCITPGQSSELIAIATEEKSDFRLALVGALCSKYQNEIVDHLLSSMGPHTLAYMTRVAQECDLPADLLSRLLAGSLPFFTKSESDRQRIACCQFITQIMKNFTEKEETLQKPFSDALFEPIYVSLSAWHETKPTKSLVLRDRALESMTWLCHGLPWAR